jgi:hypothetical protein
MVIRGNIYIYIYIYHKLGFKFDEVNPVCLNSYETCMRSSLSYSLPTRLLCIYDTETPN